MDQSNIPHLSWKNLFSLNGNSRAKSLFNVLKFKKAIEYTPQIDKFSQSIENKNIPPLELSADITPQEEKNPRASAPENHKAMAPETPTPTAHQRQSLTKKYFLAMENKNSTPHNQKIIHFNDSVNKSTMVSTENPGTHDIPKFLQNKNIVINFLGCNGIFKMFCTGLSQNFISLSFPEVTLKWNNSPNEYQNNFYNFHLLMENQLINFFYENLEIEELKNLLINFKDKLVFTINEKNQWIFDNDYLGKMLDQTMHLFIHNLYNQDFIPQLIHSVIWKINLPYQTIKTVFEYNFIITVFLNSQGIFCRRPFTEIDENTIIILKGEISSLNYFMSYKFFIETPILINTQELARSVITKIKYQYSPYTINKLLSVQGQEFFYKIFEIIEISQKKNCVNASKLFIQNTLKSTNLPPKIKNFFHNSNT
jgi:hypothetical protein